MRLAVPRRFDCQTASPLSSPPSAQLRTGAGTHNHRPGSLRQAGLPTFATGSPGVMGPGSRSLIDGAYAPQGARLSGTTKENTTPHSRGAISRPGLEIRCPSRKRGRRECRALNAPAASWAEKGRRPTSVVTTGSPKHSGTPCAMALRLTPCSPRGIGLVSPRPPGLLTRGLTPASR
jgi:hypothetical protein